MAMLDTYSVKARIAPAFLAIAPTIGLAGIAVRWDQFSLPQAIATASVVVLFVAFSDLARRFGKAAETELFKETGGKPALTLLTDHDHTFDPTTKDRYRAFLADLIGEKAPPEESGNSAEVAAYYVRCGNWLRENTRDHTKFNLLFEENITYGFRRNLYGVKPAALALNFLVILSCLGLLYFSDFSVSILTQVATVLVIAMFHATYFLLAVTKKSVLAASDQYARQLVLSAETLVK